MLVPCADKVAAAKLIKEKNCDVLRQLDTTSLRRTTSGACVPRRQRCCFAFVCCFNSTQRYVQMKTVALEIERRNPGYSALCGNVSENCAGVIENKPINTFLDVTLDFFFLC